MKETKIQFDDGVKLPFKEVVAMSLAATQVIMPFVLGFLAAYCIIIYLLMKIWLKQ